MCVLYACQTKVPDERELESGHWSNDDGAGVAWIEKDHVRWEKGIDDDKGVIKLLKNTKIKPPLIIHFRTASCGGPLKELTHPFPLVEGVPTDLSGTAPSVLFHNGHWQPWEDKYMDFVLSNGEEIPDGPFSDTRAIAHMMLKCGFNLGRIIPGKFALLDKDGLYCHGKNWHDVDEKEEKGYFQSSSTYTTKQAHVQDFRRGKELPPKLIPLKAGGGGKEIVTVEDAAFTKAVQAGEGKHVSLPFGTKIQTIDQIVAYTPEELEEILHSVEKDMQEAA